MNKSAILRLIRNGDILADHHKQNPSAEGRVLLARWAVERIRLERATVPAEQRAAKSAAVAVQNTTRSAELRAAGMRPGVVRIPNPIKKRRPGVVAGPFGFVEDPKIFEQVFKLAATSITNKVLGG